MCPRAARSGYLGGGGVGRIVVGEAAGPAEPPAHSAQHQDRGDAQREVEHDDRDERDPDPGVGGGRVLDLHDPVDDPRLAADLGHDPAGLHADHGQDTRGGCRPQEPSAGRHPAPERPAGAVPHRQQEQQCPQAHHDVPGEMDDVDLTHGRSFVRGHRVQPLHDRRPARARVGQPRGQPRDGDAATDRAVVVEPAQQGFGDVAARGGHQLDRGELDRLVVVHPAGQRVSHTHLDRCRDRRDTERDDEPQPVVAVRASPQHARGVHRGDEEATDEIGGDDHVRRLQRHRVVEDHL